ncbi:MAG: PA14 domain-containing protein [Kiritimatiellia bacterium]
MRWTSPDVDTKILIQPSGRIVCTQGRIELGTITPGLFEEGWKGGTFGSKTVSATQEHGIARGEIKAPSGGTVEVELRSKPDSSGLRLDYLLRSHATLRLNSLHVSFDLPAYQLAGCEFSIDGQPGVVPSELGENYILNNRPISRIRLSTRSGAWFELLFPRPIHVLFQDNRKWGPSFSLRIGEPCTPRIPVPQGAEVGVSFVLVAGPAMTTEYDGPVTIEAGEEWIPLDYNPEIEPGSVLDFSRMGFHDPPAGRHGRVIATPDGHFAFEKRSERPQRFYGVNFCFSSQFLRHEEAERVADRLVRLGYNAVRLHHYDDILVHGEPHGISVGSINLDVQPDKVEYITKLETPIQEGERYGQRIRGLIHPPATGEYIFSIASDDSSQLWLSADSNPSDKVLIAWVEGWTGWRQFDKYPSQVSKPVSLESGKAYYIEVLHKEGTGGDHLSVAWQGPDIAGIVDGKFLSPEGQGTRGSALREVWHDPIPRTEQNSTVPLPEAFDRLDYFVAALKRRGIYVTTDLFVSRLVPAREIWPDAEGNLNPDDVKMAIPVNDRAFDNWKRFTQNFLLHKNPYTGLTYAEDPVLAWLSMINEGNYGNYLGRMDERVKADWQRKWNRFLKSRYRSREALLAAWQTDPGGDPQEGTVPLWTNIAEDSRPARDMIAFCAQTERETFRKMRHFIREELGCRALLTNMNGWVNRLGLHAARLEYDYVDDHFYVDHPHFLQQPWRLPSWCLSDDPVALGAPGGSSSAFVRVLHKPFTLTEFNYSAPGKFRAAGGLLTGSLAAMQDWAGVWRFAYAHNRDNLFRRSAINYFDTVSDPINQLSERAALLLFLRGDMQCAPRTLAIGLNPEDLFDGRLPNYAVTPPWSALAWIFRVGTILASRFENPNHATVLLFPLHLASAAADRNSLVAPDPFAPQAQDRVFDAIGQRGWLGNNRSDPGLGRYENITRQLLLDSRREIFGVTTERTAGGCAPAGATIEAGAVTIHIERTHATVWVSSTDGQPIPHSSRLLVCHLTDIQNTGARFAEHSRQTLLEWGRLPHLVLEGKATIRIRTVHAVRAEVYALAPSGRRLDKVSARAEGTDLIFTLHNRGKDDRARLLYEVVVQ